MNTTAIIIGILVAAAVLLSGCTTPSGTGVGGLATTIPTPPPAAPSPPGNIAAALTLAGMRAELSESFEEALAYPLTGDYQFRDSIRSMDDFDAGAASFADTAGITRPDHVQEYAEFQAILMMKDSFQASVAAMSDEFRERGSVSPSAIEDVSSQYGDLSTELDRFYVDYTSRVPAGPSDAGPEAALRLIDMKCAMLRASGDVFGYLLTGEEGRTQDFSLELGDLDNDLRETNKTDMDALPGDEEAINDLLDTIGTFELSAHALIGEYDRGGAVRRFYRDGLSYTC